MCKLHLNSTLVPHLWNRYSIFNGTNHFYTSFTDNNPNKQGDEKEVQEAVPLLDFGRALVVGAIILDPVVMGNIKGTIQEISYDVMHE